ncbi:MAG: DUF1643 domain-containing protein [Clostridia bacterium]|nr:DUF1643 domain-containing protein [Clostridia bacterium]
MCDINDYQKEYTAVYKCLRTPPDNRGYNGPQCRYLLRKEGDKPLIIIGCNPSTANEGESDPTMIKVSQFCQRRGHGGYIMLNLYPQIAPNVDGLPDNINGFDHAIHAINMEIIEKILKENNSSDILLSFGGLIEERDYLYDPCFLKIIDIINNNNYINRLKRLSLNGNIFRNPLHFGYAGITSNVIAEDQLVLVDFNLQEYIDGFNQ